MTAAAAALEISFPVGKRFIVKLTLPQPISGALACACAEWDPHLPERLNRRERRDYERGRDAAVRELSRRIASAS